MTSPLAGQKSASKKILFFFLIQLLAMVSVAQMRQVYIDADENNNIGKASFYSPSQGYVGFYKWVGYTTDSGHTFTKKYITWTNVDFNGYFPNLTFGFAVKGVKAFSQNELIVYGDYGAVPGILYSSDNGDHFRLIYLSQINFQQLSGIADMVFPQNGNIGYAVEPDRIIKTIDRGKSWFPIVSDPNAVYNFVESVDDNIVMAGTDTKILRTTNGGATWQPMSLPAGQVLYAHFISANKGWISLWTSNGSVLFYTSNGGTNWRTMSQTGITRMKFINDSTGYALGSGYSILKTTDSGKIWQPLPVVLNQPEDYQLADIHFVNNNQFWAGGRHGFLELTTNAGGEPLPRAFFNIDTAGLSISNTVRLVNHSKSIYQYKWLKNGVLISTSYNASYQHTVGVAVDTIQLVVSNGVPSDTAVDYQYFIVPPPPPVSSITSFTPVAGTTGSVITITGANLNGASAVSFGGTPASTFTVVSAATIKATVAFGASGIVSVTTPYGIATKAGFDFTAQLRVTSFSPISGSVGTLVQINGTNFNSNAASNTVYFGAVKATVAAASSTQLLVAVPPGATYEPLSVTVNNRIAYSTLSFVPTFAGGGSIDSATYVYPLDHITDGAAIETVSSDIDGDGKVDILTVCGGTTKAMTVLQNTSTVDSFSLAPKKTFAIPGVVNARLKILVSDMDGDGKPDVVVNPDQNNPGISIFRNTSVPGSVTFATRNDIVPINGTIDYTGGMVAADFDGDGKTDIFIGNDQGGKAVLQNLSTPGNFSFSIVGGLPTGGGFDLGDCAATDIDGDNKPDLLLAGFNGLTIYKNTSVNGVISFANPIVIGVPDVAGLIIGDVDMDGKPDIITSTAPDLSSATPYYISVHRNNSIPGTISILPQVSFIAPNGVKKQILSDINGDGKPDLAMAIGGKSGDNNASLAAIQNNSTPGTISFGSLIRYNTTFGAQSTRTLTAADFDGNGRPDIALLNTSTKVAVFLNHIAPPLVTVCAGSATILPANLVGNTYQWQQNTGSGFGDISNGSNATGVNSAALQLNSIPLAWDGSLFRCVVDGNAGAVTTVKVGANIASSVSITASAVDVCKLYPPTFTATPVNGGAHPAYKWYVNNNSTGLTSSNIFTPSQQMNTDGNKYRVVLYPDFTCALPATDTSNSISVKVTPSVSSAIVAIIPSALTICPGSTVEFRATTIDAGSSPSYQWYQDFKPVGNNSDTYITNTITHSGTPIEVVVTSNVPCTNRPQARVTIGTVTAPSISIATPSTTICANSSVTFTATILNPLFVNSIKWKRNGADVGGGNTYTTSTLVTGDVITAVLSSDVHCNNGGLYNSNSLTMTVTPSATINIAGATTVNAGQASLLTATIVNGGSAPVFQWQDSTELHTWENIIGATASTLSYKPTKTGNKVRCALTSNFCASPVNVTSQAIQFIVNPVTAIGTVPAADYGIRWQPNPVRSMLTIKQLRLSERWTKIEITAADGRQNILSVDVTGKTEADVYVDKLPAGVYIAVLKSSKGQWAYFKFIKL